MWTSCSLRTAPSYKKYDKNMPDPSGFNFGYQLDTHGIVFVKKQNAVCDSKSY